MEKRKYNILCCVFLLLLSGVNAYGQPDVAQLFRRLNLATVDTQKVLLLDSIAYYYRDIKTDTAITFAHKALDLSQESKYIFGEGKSRMMLSLLYCNAGNMEDANLEGQKALVLLKKIQSDAGVATTYNQLGVNAARSGNYETATKYLLEAEKIYEKRRDTAALVLVYQNLSNIVQETISLDKGMEYLTKALGYCANNSARKPDILNNVGIIYGKKGDLDKALYYFNAVLNETDSSSAFVRVRIKALLNCGIVYDKKGEHKKAFKFINDDLSLARKYHMRDEEANALSNLADIETNLDPKMAIQHLKEAAEIAKAISNKPMEVDIYKTMISLYVDQKDYKNAFFALDQQTELASQLVNIEKSKQINKMQANYELGKSNLKVEQLKEINRKNETWKNTMLLFACCITIALLVIILYYRQTIILNRQLVLQKDELKQLNIIKDKLFSVIGHDLRSPVGSIVSLLSIWETDGISEEEKKDIIHDLKGQTRATLETLDKLLNWGQAQIKGISIFQTEFAPKRVIKDSLELLKEQAAQKSITITDNCPADIRIYADRLQFDFVVRNLLSNAIKFTHVNGNIEISVDRYSQADYTIFKISDNGVGISPERRKTLFDINGNSTPGTANEKGTNIGLKLCKEYINSNGGNIWVESEQGKGSTFFFTLKNRA